MWGSCSVRPLSEAKCFDRLGLAGLIFRGEGFGFRSRIPGGGPLVQDGKCVLAEPAQWFTAEGSSSSSSSSFAAPATR